MSEARDLWGSVNRLAIPGSDEDFDKLCRAAELWRNAGQLFSAGACMMDACRLAWGKPERMLAALRTAVADLERVVAERPEDEPASIAALYKLRQAVWDTSSYFDVDRASAAIRVREIGTELAQRLFVNFKDTERADNYLVRGIVLVTDRDGHWETRYPNYEVPLGVEEPGTELLLNIPSAFRLFVSNGEWITANEIVQSRQHAFTTPGLRGWRFVTIGNALPKEAVRSFDQAADAFEDDKWNGDHEDLLRRGGHWSSANQDLWAKYYRARARVIESIEKPGNVRTLLEDASHILRGTDAGWVSTEVSKFQVVINVLKQIVSESTSINKEEALLEYQRQIQTMGETKEDQSALTFIAEAADGLAGFMHDPFAEVTKNRLQGALRALERIPGIGPEVADVLRPEIGKKAVSGILGPYRTWMHKSLEAIKDEAQLQRILLRLLQSELPIYAQIRHGALEYGKDVALVEIEGVNVLRMYQVKCGNIDRAKWRQSKDEMEEMFQVPLESFQLRRNVDRREGILITNGHAIPYTEPVIEGWLKHQREQMGRTVEFLNLDALVDWIVENRLVNELRAALADEGIHA